MSAERRALVTGATSGIGREIAIRLAAAGFLVGVHGRDPARVEAVVAEITAAGGRAEGLLADFERLDEVGALAARVAAWPRLDRLVNNAGLVTDRRALTVDGHERTFAVNHLAPFRLTLPLVPRLVASAPARVVTVSSDAHFGAAIPFDDLAAARSFSGFERYRQSKLANVLFTRALARRLDGTGVVAHAVHPGFVATGFARDAGWIGWFMRLMRPVQRTAAQGAATPLLAALDPAWGERTGAYLSGGRERAPSRVALDEAVSERLWRVSAELVGLPPDGA